MIKVSGLKKAFKNTEVLKDINFEVKDGETVVIIGPSGSGKSTLLRCLNYLEKPDAGLIDIGDVSANTERVKKPTINKLRMQTSMVFQHYNLFKNKTVLGNITYPLTASKKFKKEEAVEIGEKLLGQVGILDKSKQYPVALSGGQQQRVGIARALAADPHAILFDEPTSSLDPEWVGEVLKVISDISKKEKTMIIVTHEMDFAKEIADRVIFMADGHIVEEGTPEEIFDNPENERTRKFLRKYTNHSGSIEEETIEPELVTV
ncbi:amino acid ABC transporter ATP-binding protein [Salinicoccus halodurans]|uniref:Amino acid ABC transporter ATP-binding protein n=1 Tax=Salinicoccus halodurans TaxID=407035 RepID=A0A0F7HIN1_9STAP|nr:amino acid ABC transporter ATP-binding protein [Salinicoccus halodurans]AKG72906.1 amino acid ABC transporter ATP-binding protein [Salinicoccus halodurans]SFK75930.1 amino acid ABC transporter ATP-binding protein, PAAT family [Salinicoccus halodurans]